MLALLAGFVAVWTLCGVIAKSSQDLHFDMTELIAWSRDLALGFPKHPPFAAVIVRGWFALLPITDASYYLLGIVSAALALWIASNLFADYLSPAKRLIGVALLTFIPFFTFHALKFNVNTPLMPLWALTTFLFLRSYRTRSLTYAILAGGAAALCMLTKYWSVCLLVGLGVAALSHPQRGAYFRSWAPWLTAITSLALFSPHLVWLQMHGFPTVVYAVGWHGHHTPAAAAWSELRYVTDTIAFGLVPVAVVVLAARPSLAMLRDMAWPADPVRRMIAVAFWTTLLFPVLPAAVFGIELDGIWTMSAWTLLPVLLLSPPALQVPRPATRWIVGAAIAFPLAMLLIAPIIALVAHEQGLPPKQAQIRQLKDEVEKAWRRLTPKPLVFVSGDMDLADGVAAYAKDKPLALLGTDLRPPTVLAAAGIALVCLAEDDDCAQRAVRIAGFNPGSVVSRVVLKRRFLGIDGAPQDYQIAMIPPRPAQ